MLCQKCKEHIEVGEACTTVRVGQHVRYLHLGCARTPEPKRDDAQDRELERLANQARQVC